MQLTNAEKSQLAAHGKEADFVDIKAVATEIRRALQEVQAKIAEMSRPVEERMTGQDALLAVSPAARAAQRVERSVVGEAVLDGVGGGSFLDVMGEITGLSDADPNVTKAWDRKATMQAVEQVYDEERKRNSKLIERILQQDENRFVRETAKMETSGQTVQSLQQRMDALQRAAHVISQLRDQGMNSVDINNLHLAAAEQKKTVTAKAAPKGQRFEPGMGAVM